MKFNAIKYILANLLENNWMVPFYNRHNVGISIYSHRYDNSDRLSGRPCSGGEMLRP